MPGADYLNAVFKDKQTDRCADEIVAVYQCVDQKFLKY